MMNDVKEKVSECSWSEIASVRRHNVCGVVKTAQIVTRLNSKRNRSDVDSMSWGAKPNGRYVKVEKLVDEEGLDDPRYLQNLYGPRWEEKVVSSNGQHHDYFIPKTTDEHINLQNIIVNDGRCHQLKYTPGAPEIGPRRDSWAYVEHMKPQLRQHDAVRQKLFPEPHQTGNQVYFLNRQAKQTQQAPTVEDIYRSVLCRRTFPPKLCSSSNTMPLESSPSYLYYSRPPTLLADHVYRGKVHYSAAAQQPQMPPALADFQVLPKINSGADQTGLSESLQRIRGTVQEDRRSWYDNVDSEDQVDCKRAVNNGDVLPPPTQFQNEPEFKNVPVRSLSGHRRWPSDGSGMVVKPECDASKFISSASFDGKVNSGWSSKDEGPATSAVVVMVGNNRERCVKPEVRLPGCWSCSACTYLNPTNTRICDMCSRSRRPGAESDPLSSGGHECQKCTLVNEKGAPKCLACGHSLENSPTYV